MYLESNWPLLWLKRTFYRVQAVEKTTSRFQVYDCLYWLHPFIVSTYTWVLHGFDQQQRQSKGRGWRSKTATVCGWSFVTYGAKRGRLLFQWRYHGIFVKVLEICFAVWFFFPQSWDIRDISKLHGEPYFLCDYSWMEGNLLCFWHPPCQWLRRLHLDTGSVPSSIPQTDRHSGRTWIAWRPGRQDRKEWRGDPVTHQVSKKFLYRGEVNRSGELHKVIPLHFRSVKDKSTQNIPE